MKIYKQLASGIGVELGGLNPQESLSDKFMQFLKEALIEHHLILIRHVDLSPDSLIQLAQVFGTTESYPEQYHLPKYPNVMNMDSTGGIRYNLWHVDGSYNEYPSAVIAINAKIIPDSGGDTLWSNMHAVYDSLTAPMKRYLDQLVGIHDIATVRRTMNRFTHYGKDYKEGAQNSEHFVEHPVVRRHPSTGRKSLFISPHSLAGFQSVDTEEAEIISRYLYAQSIRPEFVYRHRWQVGDLIIWDNRCTLHYAMADFIQRRLMYRCSTLDERPRS